MNMKKTLSMLLLASSLLVYGDAELVSLNVNGLAMQEGAGAVKTYRGVWRSVVSPVDDSGRVLFLAAETFGKKMYYGGYLRSGDETTLLDRGFVPIFGDYAYVTNVWQGALLPDGDFLLLQGHEYDMWLKNSQEQTGFRIDLSFNDVFLYYGMLPLSGGAEVLVYRTYHSNTDEEPNIIFRRDETGVYFQSLEGSHITLPRFTGKVCATGDGNTLFFSSTSLTDAPEDTAIPSDRERLYSFDRTTGQISFITGLSTASIVVDDAEPSVSADGNTLAFAAGTKLLDYRYSSQQIYVRRTEGSRIIWQLASLGTDGKGADRDCTSPEISRDGRFLVFASNATNLDPEADGSHSQIYLYDCQLQELKLLSRIADSAFPADCESPAISPNGRYVTFTSKTDASGAPAEAPQVFRCTLPLVFDVKNLACGIGEEEVLSISNNFVGTALFRLASPVPGELGVLLEASGAAVVQGNSYNVDSLPWCFRGTAIGSRELTFEVSEDGGNSWTGATMTLTVSESLKTCLSRDWLGKVQSSRTGTFSNVHSSYSGETVLFTTNTRLAQDDTNLLSDLYLSVNGVAQLIPNASVIGAALSGNGKVYAYVDSTRKLHGAPAATLPENENMYSPVLALSYDGTAIAYISTEGTLLLQKGQNPPEIIDSGVKTIQGAANSLRMDMDGNVLVYQKDDGAYCWRSGSAARKILEGKVTNLTLSHSGRFVYYEQGGVYCGLELYEGAAPRELLQAAGRSSIQIAGNWVYYIEDEKLWRIAIQESTPRIISDCYEGFGTAVANGDGTKVTFVTAISYCEDDINEGLDLYQCRMPSTEAEWEITASGTVTENPGGEPVTWNLPLGFTTPRDFIPLLDSVTGKAQVQVTGPAWNRQAYALNIIPEPYFCGPLTMTFNVWNGVAYTEKTLVVTVENVDNATEWTVEKAELVLDEGTSAQLDLSSLVLDMDMEYSDFTGEKLTFTLTEPAEWTAVDEETGVFTGDLLGNFDLLTRDAPNVFQFVCRVSDKAGHTADLPVEVTVNNVNRPPVMGASQINAREGELLLWEDFRVTDPDKEDGGCLFVHFKNMRGILTAADGSELSGNPAEGIPQNLFPLRYIDGEIGNTSFRVYVSDAGGAESDDCIVEVLLIRQNLELSALWDMQNQPEVHSSPNQNAWHLLSVPLSLDQENTAKVEQWLGSEIWVWKNEAWSIADTLQAGQGFMCRLSAKPAGTCEITGKMVFSNTVQKGWNPTGPMDGIDFTDNSFRVVYKFSGGDFCFVKSSAAEVKRGEGCWAFTAAENED